ncbi:MAG: DUF3160 domain-containing protein [Deltaproteobacteria bacterium]|nr:DUF3160 domain-containing protein [Deltaproteobacteria bacterium]
MTRSWVRGVCAVSMVVALFATACTESRPPAVARRTTPRPRPTVTAPAAPARGPLTGPPFPVASASNLGRIGRLSAKQRSLLESQGFFLAPQPPRPSGTPSADEAVTAQRATHLFHVYERNDYIRFPSYVTADLAIDATHAYFDALLREVESEHLVPRLRTSLIAFVRESDRMRRGARSAAARATATRIETFWAVALSLLERGAPGDAPDREVVARPEGMDEGDANDAPEAVSPPQTTPIPAAVRAEVARIVTRVMAAEGQENVRVTSAPVDMSQMRPRGHYTRTGVLMRWFRAMSWLGMVAFPFEGQHADLEGVAALARSTMAPSATPGAEAEPPGDAIESLIALTAFFVGGPDTSGLAEARRRLTAIVPNAGRTPLDALIAPDVLARYGQSLAELPAPRIASGTADGARQLRVAGRRAFEDAVALSRLIGSVTEGSLPPRDAIAVTFGAVGAAAVLGSDEARRIVVDAHPARRAEIEQAITSGRAHLDTLESTRWEADAYHGTIHALRALFEPAADAAPALVRTPQWRARALLAFAGGWAELRHDTILYGEQLGAECDAPEYEPPDAWVEPVPDVYRRLSAVVRALDARLRGAGITMDQPAGGRPYATVLAQKTELVVGLLGFLQECAELQIAGAPLGRDRLTRLTQIGGEVEWLLIALANTDLLSDRDRDMAIVADVFTWRPTGEAVEVGIAHPDLVYALIPTPNGPVVARGAVMSYREMLQPIGDRLTDESWRAMIAAGNAPERPAWARPLYAEPVPSIALVGEGTSRCGPSSGSRLEL